MMKNWYISLIVLGIMICGINPLHAAGVFTTSTGDNYVSADDYYQSFSYGSTTSLSDSVRCITTGVQTSRFAAGLNSSKEGFYESNNYPTLGRVLLGNAFSNGDDDDDDDDDRPGHQSDPGVPVGALPFAFMALLAGGYAVRKGVRITEWFRL